MGLEYKIASIDNNNELCIDARNTIGDKSMWITSLSIEGNLIDYNSMSLEDMLELGLFLNHKLGFDFIDTREVEKQIELEKENKD